MEYQVTLTEMLDARERRLAWQKRLLTKYRIPMVCFTMNIAGPIKKSPLIQRGFELGKRYLKEQLDSLHIQYVYYEEICASTGNEACYLINADPIFLKDITCSIEDSSEIGRLFDMDVLKPDGKKVDRSQIGLSMEILHQLDLEFIEKNLSPGGSADLLAVCYLLYFLETEV